MKPEYRSKKVGVTALCRVSKKGGAGLYLYVPRNFGQLYDIDLADFVEVHFEKVFIKTWQKDKNAPKDLTPRVSHRKEKDDF